MRNLLVIYNVIFLLVGNVLFSNIHYLNEHNHETHEHNECEECINYRNSQNYISDFNEVALLSRETDLIVYEYFSTIQFSDTNISLSRAPPIF
ncbi:MAG: hypothetical protein H8E85_06150 [Candidatus Marinimicrobia bacterium]|nr:hypothetical protein [Candidatus Neomarinimicrobiota bacterium]